jgi:hypothetical protein
MHTKYCAACAASRQSAHARMQKAAQKALRQTEANRRRDCTTCGREFLRPAGRSGNVTRCEACRTTPISRRTLPDSRPCEQCGTVLVLAPYSNRRFCQTCNMERKRESDRQAKQRARPPKATTLTCQSCGVTFAKNPRGRIPRTCPDCRANDYESRRPPRATTPRDRYRWRLARQYGLTLEQRDAMAARQGHKCALCGAPESPALRLHVDHDHACCPTSGMSCGKCVRGLVCGPCNRTLGLLNEDAETLAAMARYLRSGGAPGSPNRKRSRD